MLSIFDTYGCLTNNSKSKTNILVSQVNETDLEGFVIFGYRWNDLPVHYQYMQSDESEQIHNKI